MTVLVCVSLLLIGIPMSSVDMDSYYGIEHRKCNWHSFIHATRECMNYIYTEVGIYLAYRGALIHVSRTEKVNLIRKLYTPLSNRYRKSQ